MKSSVALLATLLAVGTGVNIFAQDSNHAVGLPTDGGYSTTTGLGSTSKNTGAAQPSDNTPSNVDGDETVVRMKTQESLGAGSMSRDEGELTRKHRPKERVAEVDSTKKLKTSGSDPKFQSSLLHSSVTSIADVSAKPSQAVEGQAPGPGQEQGAAQGVTRPLRHKIFVTENNDESKKNETAPAKADSSPSPSPSPSASPDAAHR